MAHHIGPGEPRSGDQDGFAGQLPGGRLVVDGGQVGQRPPLGHLDPQVSGVDLDNELSNMVLYQQAYSAGARVLQTATQLFSTLIGIQTSS